MINPYRIPGAPHRELRPSDDDDDDGDGVLACLLIAIGGLRVSIALITDEAFGSEPSVAAIMVGLGAVLAMRRRR